MTSRSPARVVSRSSRQQDDELRRDILAVAVPGHPDPSAPHGGLDADAILSRPTLLRRIAGRAAAHVRPGTDRLVAGERDAALATALALHTGLPVALLVPATERTAASPRGELHPLERVVLLACLAGDLPGLHASCSGRGVGVAAAVAVLGGSQPRDDDVGEASPPATDVDVVTSTLFHTAIMTGGRG